MKKFKKALALVVAFVMAVSVLAVAPSTSVSAAPSKYVKSLKVSKSKLTLEAGKSAKVKATVKVKGSASKKVKVTLSKANKKVVKSVKVGKPDKKGVSTLTIKAANVTKKTSTTIKVVTSAKNSKNKKITKSIKVTVNPKKAAVVVPTSVTVNAPKTAITVGETIIVTATVLPANAQDKSVTYSTSNAAVATVTNTGAVLGIGEGTATITAKTSNGKTGSVQIKVSKVEVTGITLDKTSVDLFVSGTTTLSPTVTPANATNKAVTWASSDETVATVKDGQVTAVSVGTATITATTANGIKAECKVNVTKKTTLADGLTVEMTNPYVDGSGKEFANTQLIGDDMTIQTRVVKDGQPVGNINVTLRIKALYGNCPNAFEVRDASVVTDSNGYANFAIGLKDNYDYTAVDNLFQSLIVTAKESGSNTEQNITVKYATISLDGISVINGLIPYPKLVPADNATFGDDGRHRTTYLVRDKEEEYVTSQQVSSNEDDHRVYFSAAPYLVLPATSENAHIGDWEYVLGKEEGTSGPCSVYNDATNETTTVQVASIPSGLNFITLHFNEISLSKYTAMDIDVCDAATGAVIFEQQVTTNGAQSIQVPIQKDKTCYLVVSLVSKGQVDTSHKGYVLTKIVGNWASQNNELTTAEEIAGAVKWTNVTSQVTYQIKEWTLADARNYIPADSTFLDEKYTYSYKVPVFPYTGDAIIEVKDSKNEVVANFLYPTQNTSLRLDPDGDEDIDGENVNELAPASDVKAVMASVDESTRNVGSLTQEGNIAIVDSTETGKTVLKAEISVAGLDEAELNSQNGGVLYTSVQWTPLPIQEVTADIPDFFAIEGQNVEITAQLFDKSGNKATRQDENITFKVEDEKVDVAVNSAIGKDATITSVTSNGTTDEHGSVTLSVSDVTSNTLYSYITNITAEAKGYDVKLSVGGQDYVDAADIFWVDLGLYFIDSAVANEGTTTIQWANETGKIAKTAEYVVDDKNGWQIAYRPIARASVFDVDDFVSVTGVNLKYGKDVPAVDLVEKDNVAILDTTKSGETVLTGTIVIPDPTKVTFTFLDASLNPVTYKNVGKGDTNAELTALALNTKWDTKGVNLNLIYPKTVYENTAATVYVVVADDYGNPIEDANVEYSISGINEKPATTGKTDDKGVYAIQLAGQTYDANADVSKITVKVNNSDELTKTFNINYKDAEGTAATAFTMIASDDQREIWPVVFAEDKKTVTVYFTNAIDPESVNAGQFTFEQDNATDVAYKITSAQVGSENNSIVLTLDKEIQNPSAAHTLTINAYEDNKTGIVYNLIDTFGQVYVSDSYTVPAKRY